MAEMERILLKRLNGIIHLGLAAHASRVDQHILAELIFKIRVDRVARRTRDVGDDHALFAQDPVEKARLADVRLADDGNLNDVFVVFFVVRLREVFHAEVQQITRAVAMDRRYLDGVSKPKP